ncbi:MAG: 2-dehydropantoate 2-reductase [Bacteroidota bacterium]|nr:2-dehydropantoate 2-reductase [Bacteroidota bacterium]
MKIAIIGSGGVGGYFGGRLALAGNDVIFVARGEHLKAIKEKGLKVKSTLGNFLIHPANATNEISKIGTADLIIFSVKAFQVKGIVKELKPVIGKETTILPLENGLLTYEEICEEIDKSNVIGGLCRIASKIESPGVINHTGIVPTIIFGELDNSKTKRITRFKEIFEKAEISYEIPENIQIERWKKFIGVCLSGLLALTRSPYGVLREIEGTRRIMFELLTEVYNVALKAGMKLEENVVDKTMEFIDSLPYEASASLASDILSGKQSELDYQNGTVVNLGKKYKVDTPVNRFVYDCLLPMELQARKNAKNNG